MQGFWLGLRNRESVRSPAVSRAFRRNFHVFASPWWTSRTPFELLRALPREIVRGQITYASRPAMPGSTERYYQERASFYPDHAATLDF
jgi:hypothetical protein